MTEPSAPPSAPAAYPRTELPAGFETVFHSGEGGARLRTVHWDSGDDSRPPILFMGGKRDFIERHAESFQRIRARGHRLAALDWRDQGLSSRASCASCDLFDMMERDFLHIVEWAAELFGEPVHAVAHSMGGHMLLRTLAAHESARAQTRRLVLSAPMLGLGGRLNHAFMRITAEAMVAAGMGEHRPPGQPPYGPIYRAEERRRKLTGDEVRFSEGFAFIDKDPRLAAGGATWGWLRAAMRSMAALETRGNYERIGNEAQFLLGDHEQVVSPAAIRRAVKRMPRARLLEVADGHHELFLDTDAVQDEVWPAIWDFLG